MDLNCSAAWDRSEDKIFENCLVEIPDCAERWEMIARLIPGKSPEDVRVHYEALLFDVGQIDSGNVEPPNYPDEPAQSRHLERKKWVPWTEDEHRLFLAGLEKYGKGNWVSISRFAVISKTSTQVASHAQKYFLRQYAGRKETKRSGIHDITTTIDSLTVPTQPNVPVPDQTNIQIPSPKICKSTYHVTSS